MKGLMDVFFFPSRYEGFPVALTEAQAAGLRCFIADTISAEIDIRPELITRLSLTDGASAWAASLVKGRRSTETNLHPHAMHHFSIDAAAARLCSVYDQR
jgi:hypothetical protein